MAEQRFKVCAGDAAGSDPIRAEAEGHRRIEAVGDRVPTAEEGPARAEPAPRLVPDPDDALDVRSESRRPRAHVDTLADAHRHVAAQRREPRVHFGADRARPCARVRLVGPHVRTALGEMIGDCERIPDDRIAVVQARHEPRRRKRIVRRIGNEPGERDRDFLERLAGKLRDEPAAQRPRRIVLVADVEFHIHSTECLRPATCRWNSPEKPRGSVACFTKFNVAHGAPESQHNVPEDTASIASITEEVTRRIRGQLVERRQTTAMRRSRMSC